MGRGGKEVMLPSDIHWALTLCHLHDHLICLVRWALGRADEISGRMFLLNELLMLFSL